MKITFAGSLVARKSDAATRIAAHFNRLAADDLHAALVALGAPAALAREATRLSLVGQVNAATDPRQIERILKKLEA